LKQNNRIESTIDEALEKCPSVSSVLVVKELIQLI
jgi:hypothetical protein